MASHLPVAAARIAACSLRDYALHGKDVQRIMYVMVVGVASINWPSSVY